MWKATAKGLNSRIRIVHLTSCPKRCMVQRSTPPSSPSPPGTLKDTPAPGSMPPPAELKPPSEHQSRHPSRRPSRMLFYGSLIAIGAGAVGVTYMYVLEKQRENKQNLYPAETLDEAKWNNQGLLPKLKKKPDKIEPQPGSFPPPVPPVVGTPPSTEDKADETLKQKAEEVQKQKVEDQKKLEAEIKARDAVDRKLREKQEARRRQEEKENAIAAENAALEVSLENLMEVCDVTVRKAKDAASTLIETTKQHTDLLKTAMEDTSNVLDKDVQWQSVSMAFEKREDAANAGQQILVDAKENLEKLRHAIDEGRKNSVTKKNAALTMAKEKLNQLSKELNIKQNELTKVESESRVMSKYKDLVDKGKEQFKKEIESLMPDVIIGKGRKLSEEELNTLIAHAHRRIEQLQKQLAQQLALEQQRMQQALSDQRDEDELITQARVKQERQKLFDEFSVEKDKWEAEAQVQFEIELRRNLARQTAAHSDHIKEVLRLQEEKLVRDFEHELHMRIIEDRKRFEGELSGWKARLRGIEAAVTARAEREMVAQEAQALWLACVALNGAIRTGNENGETWEEQLKPLEKEVDRVFFAAKNNPLVCLVLDSIPEKALKRGVYTEENLKERFRKVSRVAKRVALIDETGGSLPKFFMSYLQSLFMIPTVYAKDVGDSVDLETMDTFQICSHAKYWIEKNDIEQALKFMNLLTGESRRVAADWIEEARLLLETRQATYTLMAFASSTGLGTVF